MATKMDSSDNSNGLFAWRSRARYRVGKTRRQRQAQYRQQMNALMMIVLATVIAGLLVVMFNWRGAGSTKTASCATYPHYCVPLVGGSTIDEALEGAEVRELDEDSHGADGVVRGISEDNVPFIGNPDAPIHFRTVSNFACSHCNGYHTGDLSRFIEDYVLTGQATLSFVMNTGTAPQYTYMVSQAALCAGEQGAYWEMSDELFRLARTQGLESGFSLVQMRESADDMGLDADELVACITSERYGPVINEHDAFSMDVGVTGTPTLLVRYAGDTEWTRLDHAYRGYDSMKAMTEAANASAN